MLCSKRQRSICHHGLGQRGRGENAYGGIAGAAAQILREPLNGLKLFVEPQYLGEQQLCLPGRNQLAANPVEKRITLTGAPRFAGSA